jgi:hypothetical protein
MGILAFIEHPTSPRRRFRAGVAGSLNHMVFLQMSHGGRSATGMRIYALFT